ncbi:MAG: proline--tRNA ligase [Actinobacteria bacterium]|nr:proline--tRNA ligase [Actinomycetota bacterium]
MILRMSTLFLRTLREDPADAEVPSHTLLVRAGYVRRVAPGIFTWLPLGWRVFRKVEQIVRDEMDAFGAQEVHFPALLPREPYEATARWTEYGQTLFRLQDRKGSDMLLGPTHEEMFTLLVKSEYSSYKDLPLSLYQIQTKYRDEARPRAGILRGREFVMKDSYSFDLDDAGLQESYEQHRQAYIRIFDRLGLEYVIVSAMAGAMGGSQSEEFLAPCVSGEDTFVRSTDGLYAANVEAVVTPAPAPVSFDGLPAAHVEATPNCETIDDLVALSNRDFPRADGREWTAADTLKNVVLKLTYLDDSTDVLVVGVPGDREVDLRRLEAAVFPATVEPLGEEDFAKHPALVRGYIGPQVLGEQSASGIRYLVDPRVSTGSAWISGANSTGQHVYDLVVGRDFTPDGTVEAVAVRDGDLAPDGHGELVSARGIEIGHIFQLGTKYAEALELKVLNENGKQQVVTMGSYGIGVSRAVAAVAEQTYDEIGLSWPRSISPADVHIVAAGKEDELYAFADDLVSDLEEQGIEVLYDDRRRVSPGVKFKDAELIGIPTIIVIGKGLASGVLEIRDRASGHSREVATADALAAIVAEVRG